VVRNNTIANNTGYGIFMNSYAYINNCIVWGSSNSSLCYTNNKVTYSCIQGDPVYTGIGNINADPCFVDYANENYHLSPNSRCIDAGNTDLITDPNETDIDGEPRIFNGDDDDNEIVDMGADEFYWSPADLDRNEIVNFIDYAILASAWLTNDPNISLDDDNDIDMNDLARFCDDWLWESAWNQSDPLKMMMGAGYGRGAAFAELLYTIAPPQQPQIELQSEPEPPPQVQSEPEPESQPEPQPQIQCEPRTTQELIEWLEGVLEDEQIEQSPTGDNIRKMIESLKQEQAEN
jgi:hypothetical protein